MCLTVALAIAGGASDADAQQAACYSEIPCIDAGSATQAVLVPNAKLRRCELYKADSAMLDGALVDAKIFRTERDMCVGELGAVLPQLRDVTAMADALQLQVSLLKAESSGRVRWWQWAILGAVGVVTVEVGVWVLIH